MFRLHCLCKYNV